MRLIAPFLSAIGCAANVAIYATTHNTVSLGFGIFAGIMALVFAVILE